MANSQSALDLCEQIIEAEESYNITLKLQEETRLALLNSHEHLPDQYQVSASIISMYHENMVKEVMLYLQTLGKCTIPNCVKHSVIVDYENLVQLTNDISKKGSKRIRENIANFYDDESSMTNVKRMAISTKSSSAKSNASDNNNLSFPISDNRVVDIDDETFHISDDIRADFNGFRTNEDNVQEKAQLNNSDEGFIHPKQTAKRSEDQVKPTQINLHNKYTVLQNNPPEGMETNEISNNDNDSTFLPAPKASSKPPPIVISNPKINWPELAKDLKKAGISNFTGKANPETLNIRVQSEMDYRIATTVLDEKKIHFNSYKLKSERTLKVVLRNVPSDIDVETIQSELNDLGYPVSSVFQFSKNVEGNKIPIPVYFLELPNTTANKTIFNLTNFMHLKVDVAPYRRKNQPTQCHRCQRYGHAKSGCHNPPRCVKCSLDHMTVDCPTKGRIENPKCALCQGPHAASFRGCPKYPKPRQNNSSRTPSTPVDNALPSNDQTSDYLLNSTVIPKTPRPGVSFSQAVISNEVNVGNSLSPSTSQNNAPNMSVPTPDDTTLPPNQNDQDPDEFNLFDLLRQFQNFIKGTNIKSIIAIIKKAAQNFKSAKGMTAKIEIGLLALEELITLFQP